MHKIFFAAVGLSLAITSASAAVDCGEPPMQQPAVPDGARATPDDIRFARDAVLAYSAKVDEFIACMDARTARVAPYMTKEQITRRQEDIDELHNVRRDLQIKLNEAIRAYRQSQNS